MSRNGSRLYLHDAPAVGVAGIPVPAVFNSVAIQSPPAVYGLGSTDALKATPWSSTIISTSSEAPRLMDFDRGPAVYPQAASAALELPKATTDASTVLLWRIAHMQWVGPALDAIDIPAGAWEFGCAWENTSDPISGSRLELSVYVIDASGAIVGYVTDTDRWYSVGTIRVNYTSSARFLIPGAPISVPKGGRIVCELWWRFEIWDNNAVSIANLKLFYDGFDDDIPWDVYQSFWGGSGGVGLIREETLEEQVASYLQAPIMLRALVFDAMRDASEPTTVTREYATTITTGRDGQEQRMQTRVDPVLGMTATFAALNAHDAQSLDALVNVNSDAGYKLPWWPEVQSLAADLASGSTVIPCVTDGVSFVAGGEVILYRGPGDWELGTIESIAIDGITLESATTQDWTRGVGLMPIVRALLLQDTSLTRIAGFANNVPLTFVVAKREATGAEMATIVSGGGGGSTCDVFTSAIAKTDLTEFADDAAFKAGVSVNSETAPDDSVWFPFGYDAATTEIDETVQFCGHHTLKGTHSVTHEGAAFVSYSGGWAFGDVFNSSFTGHDDLWFRVRLKFGSWTTAGIVGDEGPNSHVIELIQIGAAGSVNGGLALQNGRLIHYNVATGEVDEGSESLVFTGDWIDVVIHHVVTSSSTYDQTCYLGPQGSPVQVGSTVHVTGATSSPFAQAVACRVAQTIAGTPAWSGSPPFPGEPAAFDLWLGSTEWVDGAVHANPFGV